MDNNYFTTSFPQPMGCIEAAQGAQWFYRTLSYRGRAIWEACSAEAAAAWNAAGCPVRLSSHHP